MQAFCAEKDSVGSLANVNKLNYLLGQLESNVLATVVGLKSSNVNYDVLANLLNEHFGREPKVIAAYTRALYTFQKLESTLKNLRFFYELLKSFVGDLE